jgi:hypothetical protein
MEEVTSGPHLQGTSFSLGPVHQFKEPEYLTLWNDQALHGSLGYRVNSRAVRGSANGMAYHSRI